MVVYDIYEMVWCGKGEIFKKFCVVVRGILKFMVMLWWFEDLGIVIEWREWIILFMIIKIYMKVCMFILFKDYEFFYFGYYEWLW